MNTEVDPVAQTLTGHGNQSFHLLRNPERCEIFSMQGCKWQGKLIILRVDNKKVLFAIWWK